MEPSLEEHQPAAAFNLMTLAMLVGTDLMPDLRNHAVMVEEVAEHLYAIDRLLFHVTHHLAPMGIAGLRLGRVSGVPENDRPFGSERSTRCDFLGGSARFPSGPMLTAAVLGVPVAAFFCLQEGDLVYDVHFELLADKVELGAGPRDAALAPWIERYVRRVEAHARQSPYNWFNFYDFWQDK